MKQEEKLKALDGRQDCDNRRKSKKSKRIT